MKSILFFLFIIISLAGYAQPAPFPPTSTRSGYVPVLPNDATKYLDGTGVYSRPATLTPNPGVYFSPAQSLDPSFIVFASCIASVGNAYSVGDTIQWKILNHTTNHNSSFFTSVHSLVGNGFLYFEYPNTKTVLNLTITPDESFSALGFVQGPSVGLTTAYAPVIQTTPNSLRLTGNGSGGWTITGNTQGFNSSTGGGYAYLGPNQTTNQGLADPNQVGITYTGPHNYHINRLFSGLGAYTVFFELQDAGGNRVTVPATTDNVFVLNMGMRSSACNMYIYNTSNAFLTTSFNFWAFGAFECWMVAAPVPSATGQILVRWQTYPSATGYKIYRDTNSNFSSPTLIYSGTNLSFTDTGLTSGTLYYYKEVATVSAVDTDITTFTSSPN